METRHHIPALLVVLASLLSVPSTVAQSQFETALRNMYFDCLFGRVENSPFENAAEFAQQTLASGFSNYVESNLAAIPLTPPSLDAEFREGEVVTTVAGFAPIFTESSATVGRGQFLVGSNVSYLNLTRVRGHDLSKLGFFEFEQNGGGDRILVSMPLRMTATVFTFYGTYGITNRLDIGIAAPIMQLRIENEGTTFRVQGNQSGCRYGPNGPNCEGQEGDPQQVTVTLNEDSSLPSFGLTELHTYLSTLAVRAKYRFPVSLNAGRVASVLDVRIPTRQESNVLGSGNFGARLMLIGEIDQLGDFKPYANLGVQYWNGDDSSSLKFAAGFNQRISSKLFFAFDLLGEFDLEDDPFLSEIDDPGSTREGPLRDSPIPAIGRDHTVHAGLGIQVAFIPEFHAFGSGLFSLLDRGLQSTVVPTVGAALYF